MGIINSSFSSVSAVFDAVAGAINGASTEANHWAKRRRVSQALRDKQYLMEQVAELEKAERKFEKLNVSQENQQLLVEMLKKMAE